ncbi:hypothetical protein GUITHDRAFT_155394 [Guillardia theta CCMP2712]|uniref:GST N-terminal domain-containing protein n=1 Tax=Guillardia theta (strain CCMP2712) TaxID=905079 RepID=L1IIR8_GUITC|nr:hypothetical protein GUITHDRAFT_155394 [Guillardia theta CCMP2712]EKX35799.1 hypothetical protein GUITHDRAFT_155394 [Guillardia theta CCMP2712]|eukprot:XP_005822779.1 hypothetical protein GUITHDRAFT_155394 [Guillardia theta CCMP2712]
MVRALLSYGDISYESVLVNMMSKKELKWSTYQKIPILVVNGMQVPDTNCEPTEPDILPRSTTPTSSTKSSVQSSLDEYCRM